MGRYNRKDHYYSSAKEHGYRSRAAYKLLELDKRFKLMRQGTRVLDLGSWPGGWLQVALSKVGPNGQVVGVDLKEIEPFSYQELSKLGGRQRPVFLTGDLENLEFREELLQEINGTVDLVISDMSPKLSGIRFADAAKSAALAKLALDVARAVLCPGGSLVAKVFPGTEADGLSAVFQESFRRVSRVNLKASRQSSNEFYFVARGYMAGRELSCSESVECVNG